MVIRLSVIIVNWNTRDHLQHCLSSLADDAMDGCEVIVVDNASTDNSADMVAHDFPDARLIRSDTNLGFAGGNNLGIQAARGRYLLLLNNDTLVQPGALAVLERFMDDQRDAAAVGPRLLRTDGTPQPYAFGGDPTLAYLLRRGLYRLVLRRYLHDWATDQVQQVDWVSGACMLVRREAIDQAGLLDENMFMYFEDSEWCLRMRQAGWKVYYNPQAEIVHIGGQSLKQNPRAQKAYYESLRYFYAKHYSALSRVLLELLLAPYRWAARRRGMRDARPGS